MSDKTLRYVIASVIALLLVHQVGSMVARLFGVLWGVLAALLVVAVSFASTRMAKTSGKTAFWFLLPALLFTVIPIGFMIWTAMTTDVTWLDRILTLSPILIGFTLPVVLLLMVYYELRKRSLNASGPA